MEEKMIKRQQYPKGNILITNYVSVWDLDERKEAREKNIYNKLFLTTIYSNGVPIHNEFLHRPKNCIVTGK